MMISHLWAWSPLLFTTSSFTETPASISILSHSNAKVNLDNFQININTNLYKLGNKDEILEYLEGYREEGLQREKEKAAYGQHQYQTKSDQKMDHWLRFPSLVAIETALLGSDPPSLWAHQSWDWLWLCCRSRPCSRTWPCKKSPDGPRGGPSGQDCRTWRCWGRGRRGGLGFGGGCGEMRWLWKEEEGGGGERVWREIWVSETLSRDRDECQVSEVFNVSC